MDSHVLTYKEFPKSYKPDYDVPDGIYKPLSPIEAWVRTGERPSNAYYGAARIIQPLFERIILNPSNEIAIWPAGTFIYEAGKSPSELKQILFREPEFKPFEHNYGGAYNYIPVSYLTFLRRR